MTSPSTPWEVTKYQFSDAQIENYIDFLLSDQPQDPARSSSESLRFKAEEYARHIDPYDAMNLHIYSDRYGRLIPIQRPGRCVIRGEDIPGYAEALKDLARQSGS
jgi:hypothetical protein